MIRSPLHPLHDEVGPPIGGFASVEKPRDSRVLQARQDSPLTRETAQDLAGVHATLDELYRNFLFEPAVGALREIDLAHAAAAERFDQTVDTDNLGVQTGAAMFVEFRYITGTRQESIFRRRRRRRTSMNVGQAGEESEWIEQRPFTLVRTGLG